MPINIGAGLGQRMRVALTLLVAVSILCACASEQYTLLRPGEVSVAQGAMTVRTPTAWNKASKGQFNLSGAEGWTQNGPMLDAIYFIGALPEGGAIVKQQPDDKRKVPEFHANMTPQDLVSMIESAYRIKGGVRSFETTGVKPISFAGQNGIQFDYEFMNEDEVRRRGRSDIAILNGKLYAISLNATVLHYFDAALPDFEAIVASARVP